MLQKSPEDNKVQQEDNDNEEHAKAASQRLKEQSMVFHEGLSGEKHQMKKRKEKKNRKDGQYQYQYQYQYDRYGQQTHRHSAQQPSASKDRQCNVIRGYDKATRYDGDAMTTPSGLARQHGKYEKDYKRSGKMKSRTAESPQPEPLLLPKGHARGNGNTVRDPQKNPRLAGADLYVARLGWCKGPATTEPATLKHHNLTVSTIKDSPASPPSDAGSASSSTSGSLYDELINRDPSPGPPAQLPATFTLDPSIVRASRPCYRCIAYMHSMGIKRVFWTNETGAWEGGKVHDLIDAMDNSMENVAKGNVDMGGPMGNGIFVTKHEVLMLKRMMGESKL